MWCYAPSVEALALRPYQTVKRRENLRKMKKRASAPANYRKT